jgi:DNA modification methylase
MKPVALWVQAMLDGSQPGERIYDPFLGSGTTLLAAQQTGRIGLGLEIEPRYCDAIVARWERFTGLVATCQPDPTQTA